MEKPGGNIGVKGQGTVEASEIHGGAERLKGSSGLICSRSRWSRRVKISKLKGREFTELDRTSG